MSNYTYRCSVCGDEYKVSHSTHEAMLRRETIPKCSKCELTEMLKEIPEKPKHRRTI